MKHPRAVNSSLHPAVIPAAVIASGLIAPLPAWTAPGDLDPGFGDVGRVELDLSIAAWSIEAEEDGYLLTGAQEESCYWYCVEGADFNTRLLDDGSLDEAYSAAQLEGGLGFDSVLQPDGKAVTVGQLGPAGDTDLAVYRLLTDGSLDPGFGVAGITTVANAVGLSLGGRRIILEPDGTITVAGVLGGNRLVVARLLPNGALDSSFAANGLFTTDATITTGIQPGLVRLSGGSYRLTAQVASGQGSYCRVLALTPTGTVDSAFGVDGLAAVSTDATGPSSCSSLALDDSDGLYVAGLGPTGEFVVRLLENGVIDPSFAGSPLAAVMADATAIATSAGGAIFVAGHGRDEYSRAQIVRLQSDGQIDAAFGSAGVARVELDAEWSYGTNINDLKVMADGGLAVTGWHYGTLGMRSFAVRLLGDGGGGGPGVLAIETVQVEAVEGGHAVVKVRRIGGSSGSVSVEIGTHELETQASATTDQDFVSTSTTLTWPDGDASEREFVIDIPADEGLERLESFAATLLNPQGGAGLGGRSSGINIRGDGYPAGMFSIDPVASQVEENSSQAQFVVYRDYGEGTVSVLVTPVGGTASSGGDYDAAPVTLTWQDGDTSPQYVTFPLVLDSVDESPETLIVELSDAQGGGVIGTEPRAQTTLVDVPGPPEQPDMSPAGGGGGGFDVLLAAALGLCAALRRRIASGAIHTGHWLDALLLGPQRLPSRRRSDSR